MLKRIASTRKTISAKQSHSPGGYVCYARRYLGEVLAEIFLRLKLEQPSGYNLTDGLHHRCYIGRRSRAYGLGLNLQHPDLKKKEKENLDTLLF